AGPRSVALAPSAWRGARLRRAGATGGRWRELAHASGAAPASRSIVRRPVDSTTQYGLGPPDLGAWRWRRQPGAAPGFAGRERQAAAGVRLRTPLGRRCRREPPSGVSTLSLHDALPICRTSERGAGVVSLARSPASPGGSDRRPL